MKKLVSDSLCLLSGIILGLSAALLAWGVPEYRQTKTLYCEMDLELIQTYSYVQYRQAEPRHAKAALARYLRTIESLRSDHIQTLDRKLDFEAVKTNLRLYRMASLAGNKAEADQYMGNAQRGAAKLGWADTSSSDLSKRIELREARELELQQKAGALPHVSVDKPSEVRRP